MGVVVEAVQESLGRRVALKLLPGSFALDPKRLERFRREARATARIHHPNIVPVYEVGEFEGNHYYAMEYIDGPSLDDMIKNAREKDAEKKSTKASSTAAPAYITRAVEQMAALAEGLEHAHRLGLIHRDVKPSNILLDSGGRAILVDFGLVREEDAQTVTRSGEMVGTVPYMSPEQVSRHRVDVRTDVYSLGVTLYEALTLRLPFQRQSDHDMQRAILFEDPLPPRKLNPRLNRDLETILLHALEKDPKRRYARAADLADDLRRYLRHEPPIHAKPPSAVRRIARGTWRHRGRIAAAAAFVSCGLRTLFFADTANVVPNNWQPRPRGHGGDDLWWTMRADPEESFPGAVNMGPPLCTTFHEVAPRISFDWPAHESTLYFSSDRPHPLACGDFDAYQATWLAAADITFEPEPPLTAGAINCGGLEVQALGMTFEEDRFFHADDRWRGNPNDGFVVAQTVLGRMETTLVSRSENPREIDLTQMEGGGAGVQQLFASETRSPGSIHYRALVERGRYEVTLYFAESSPAAVNGLGQGTRLVNVLLNNVRVLCNWSAAAAAGGGTAWDPRTAVLDTAIARTFELDVPDDGEGPGTLDIVVQYVGTEQPAGEAALNAFSFRRLSELTHEAVVGGECPEYEPLPPAPGILLAADFENDNPGTCPAGMVCNGDAFFTPEVVAAENRRLRLAEEFQILTAATAVVDQTVDVKRYALEATFDLHLSWTDNQPAEPAEGGSFFVSEGTDRTVMGRSGGDLGIPTGALGFAVEFDAWQTGGLPNEPSGFNAQDPADRWPHVGINTMRNQSLITNVLFNPGLRPGGDPGWPDFSKPVQVTVIYNAGLVQVSLKGTTADGGVFGPILVAETFVPPIRLTEAVVGFSASTGERTLTVEVDNVTIHAAQGTPDPTDVMAAALQEARDRRAGRGELYINCGGELLWNGARENPAPGATGNPTLGDEVVWIGDAVGDTRDQSVQNEFFTVTPLPNWDMSNDGLRAVTTNMGSWNARGTEDGVDQNDRIFHAQRSGDVLYEIPVEDGTYEVTLYFANAMRATAGTGQCFFRIEVEGHLRDGFPHCLQLAPGVDNALGILGLDDLYDPVDAAEERYSPEPGPCAFVPCDPNGVVVEDDPDGDGIPASQECGNAAVTAVRLKVAVADHADPVLSIALTEPNPTAGDPESPDMNPKIAGITVRPPPLPGTRFVRSDCNADDATNIADAVFVLEYLFARGPTPPCLDAADANDDEGINVADAVYILQYIFLGGARPPPPFPACGPDSTQDQETLDCLGFEPCM